MCLVYAKPAAVNYGENRHLLNSPKDFITEVLLFVQMQLYTLGRPAGTPWSFSDHCMIRTLDEFSAMSKPRKTGVILSHTC